MVGVVAHGWNINEWALGWLLLVSLSTGLCARGTGDWCGWFQVEARYWVVRLHVPPACVWGVWLVLPDRLLLCVVDG